MDRGRLAILEFVAQGWLSVDFAIVLFKALGDAQEVSIRLDGCGSGRSMDITLR